MEKRRKKKAVQVTILIVTIISFIVALGACAVFNHGKESEKGAASETPSRSEAKETEERADTGFVVTGLGDYDSADTAVLVEKNEDDKSVTFLNLELGRRYTLTFDGTTLFCDKYGESISLEQIEAGEVVDVTFLKGKKALVSMQLSHEAWRNENVEKYEINHIRNEITIGSKVYKITENTMYLSQGHPIDKMDLNPADVLTFRGIGNQVVSISVEKGHGYLRLENDENFVGGWIEIGQSVIQGITEDMLLTVPEGSYQVNISHNGGGGIKDVVINRNEETTLDIGDLEVPEPQSGMVLFSLNPTAAQIYIDGVEADASQPISLEYGLHQLIVRAEGYHSITQYIRVGQESAGIDIVLDKIDEDEEEENKDESGETDVTDTYYKVYVDAPEGAEVYLDGNYMGISPCSFPKKAGAHVITLRRTGYETRSYTVQVDKEKKDISYSFADLLPGKGDIGSQLLDSVLGN